MPAFRELVVSALLTSFGLIDSWMLSEPPLEVSNLATTHLNNMPGQKRCGSEQISCGGISRNQRMSFWQMCLKLNTSNNLMRVMVLPNIYTQHRVCRHTSISLESSCLVSTFVYDSQMFLILRKPCRPQGRLTVTSKSATSLTQPSNSIPSLTFCKTNGEKNMLNSFTEKQAQPQ